METFKNTQESQIISLEDFLSQQSSLYEKPHTYKIDTGRSYYFVENAFLYKIDFENETLLLEENGEVHTFLSKYITEIRKRKPKAQQDPLKNILENQDTLWKK